MHWRSRDVIVGTWADVRELQPACLRPEDLSRIIASDFSDDFIIGESGQQLVLSGRSERSTLYAVYQYAREQWGMNWIYPGEDKPTFAFRDDSDSLRSERRMQRFVRYSPGFERRGFVFETIDDLPYMKDMVDWLSKNRINEIFFTFMLWDRIGDGLAADIERRGMNVTLGGHSMKFFLERTGENVSDGHAEHHPYTAKRQLNYRDVSWQHALLDDLAAYCRNVPNLTRISLWPEDVAAQAQVGFLQGYICFTEKLRERLGAAGLSVEVEHIAYNAGLSWHMLERGSMPTSPAIDTLFAYWGRDYREKLDEYQRESDRRARTSLVDWAAELKKSGRSLCVFEYYSDHFMLSPLFPALPKRIAEDVAYYKELGAAGITNLVVPCREVKDHPWKWNHVFNSYVFCRTVWGDELADILNDYYGYYPASQSAAVRGLFEAIENAAAGLTYWNVPLFPSRAYDADQAQASPETEEAVTSMLNRIRDTVQPLLSALDPQSAPYRYGRDLAELSAEAGRRWNRRRQ